MKWRRRARVLGVPETELDAATRAAYGQPRQVEPVGKDSVSYLRSKGIKPFGITGVDRAGTLVDESVYVVTKEGSSKEKFVLAKMGDVEVTVDVSPSKPATQDGVDLSVAPLSDASAKQIMAIAESTFARAMEAAKQATIGVLWQPPRPFPFAKLEVCPRCLQKITTPAGEERLVCCDACWVIEQNNMPRDMFSQTKPERGREWMKMRGEAMRGTDLERNRLRALFHDLAKADTALKPKPKPSPFADTVIGADGNPIGFVTWTGPLSAQIPPGMVTIQLTDPMEKALGAPRNYPMCAVCNAPVQWIECTENYQSSIVTVSVRCHGYEETVLYTRDWLMQIAVDRRMFFIQMASGGTAIEAPGMVKRSWRQIRSDWRRDIGVIARTNR